MKTCIVLPFAAALLALPTARAQESQEPQKPQQPAMRAEPTLVPLASLAGAVVHHAQATAGEGGTRAFTPFAVVRDATFAPDGRLVALLVESADTNDKQGERRELPAKALLWDATTQRWCTDDPNLTFASLTAPANPAPIAEAAAKPAVRTILASDLAHATCKTAAKGAAPATGDAPATNAAKAAPVLWFAPAQRTLVFAAIENDGKRVLLPWAALKVGDGKDGCELQIDAVAARLADAPVCTKPDEPPPAALRRRSYEHFGVPIPKWETPTERAGTAGEHGGSGAR